VVLGGEEYVVVVQARELSATIYSAAVAGQFGILTVGLGGDTIDSGSRLGVRGTQERSRLTQPHLDMTRMLPAPAAPHDDHLTQPSDSSSCVSGARGEEPLAGPRYSGGDSMLCTALGGCGRRGVVSFADRVLLVQTEPYKGENTPVQPDLALGEFTLDQERRGKDARSVLNAGSFDAGFSVTGTGPAAVDLAWEGKWT
jgi:hypothetical protein